MRKFTSLDIKLIKDTYPKSMKKIREWLYSPDKQGDTEALFIPTEEQTEETVNLTLFFSPRTLFDFFDDQGIYITIQPDDTTGKVDGFMYYNSKSPYSSASSTRNDAEEKAFIQAFEELEKIL